MNKEIIPIYKNELDALPIDFEVKKSVKRYIKESKITQEELRLLQTGLQVISRREGVKIHSVEVKDS